MTEPQYKRCLETREQIGLERLGLMSSDAWYHDPRHVLFTLARYKFVAKMLVGQERVAEIGCGDAFGSRLVLQTVKKLHAYEIDPLFITDIRERNVAKWYIDVRRHDILDGPLPELYGAIYALDVLEHIHPAREESFFVNIRKSLTPGGALIIGTPSLESQAHASVLSKEGHVNCKTGNQLRELMLRWFKTVFVFAMNDEVVHTGFYPMAHYLLAVGHGVPWEKCDRATDRLLQRERRNGHVRPTKERGKWESTYQP